MHFTDRQKVFLIYTSQIKPFRNLCGNCNKRIGMYVMLTFLEVNGIRLDCTNDEVVEVGLAVASGAMDDETLLEWVRVHRV